MKCKQSKIVPKEALSARSSFVVYHFDHIEIILAEDSSLKGHYFVSIHPMPISNVLDTRHSAFVTENHDAMVCRDMRQG